MSHGPCKCIHIDIQNTPRVHSQANTYRYSAPAHGLAEVHADAQTGPIDTASWKQHGLGPLSPLEYQPRWALWALGVKVGLARAAQGWISAAAQGLGEGHRPQRTTICLSSSFLLVSTNSSSRKPSLITFFLSARGGGCPPEGTAPQSSPWTLSYTGEGCAQLNHSSELSGSRSLLFQP